MSPEEMFSKPTEADPNGLSVSAPGAKLDTGKAPMWRGLIEYFPNALRAVAEVSAAGHAKGYPWGGWRSVPDAHARYTDAMLRHLSYEAAGEPDDNGPGGTGLRHDAMVAWNALARLEKRITEEPR